MSPRGGRLQRPTGHPQGSLARAPALVSVVIPCHNYARFLPTAVGSALRQGGVRVEVIVVDDASTDDSLAVALSCAAEHPEVSVLAQPANLGPVGTFNHGLEAATGEFLVRLDADDALTPGSLARAVAAFRALPGVGLVYGHPVHFEGAGSPLPWGNPRSPSRGRTRAWAVWDGGDWLARRCADGFNVITSPEAMLRMSTVRLVGGQRPLAHTHDMELWLRVAAVSDVAYLRGVDQAFHRDHPHSLSALRVDELVDLRERWEAFCTLFSQPPASQLDLAALLRERARRALLAEGLRRYRRAVGAGGRRIAGGLQTPGDGPGARWEAVLLELAIDRGDRLLLWRAGHVPGWLGACAWRGVAITQQRLRGRVAWEIRRRRWAEQGVY